MNNITLNSIKQLKKKSTQKPLNTLIVLFLNHQYRQQEILMIGIFEYGKPQLISTSGLELVFFLKFNISNRDLVLCHVALLLSLVIESLWEGGWGGTGIARWVQTTSAFLHCDPPKKA